MATPLLSSGSSLTPQQAEAFRRIADWQQRPWRERAQVFRLFGFAGSGKSALVEVIQRTLFRRPQLCRIATFTGKAASVLDFQYHCDGPTTVHDLIYGLVDGPPGSLAERVTPVDQLPPSLRSKRTSADNPSYQPLAALRGVEPELIVIDECSMIGATMARDLLDLGYPVLAIGDPAQLPPVSREGQDAGFFMRGQPDFLLDQVIRQAAENPIYQYATTLRNHVWVPGGIEHKNDRGTLRIIYADKLTGQMLLDADQVIVGFHSTRHAINAWMREAKGYAARDWLPLQDEKLVCLRNGERDRRPRLLNGSLWRVQRDAAKATGEITKNGFVDLMLAPESGGAGATTVRVPVAFFHHQNAAIDATWDNFTWGDCLTCHKAQGSEWNNVLVIDEGWRFPRDKVGEDYKWRWLYTAATRAKKQLTIVRKWRNARLANLA